MTAPRNLRRNVPSGLLPSVVPPGLPCQNTRISHPSDKSLGYYQTSLRDEQAGATTAKLKWMICSPNGNPTRCNC